MSLVSVDLPDPDGPTNHFPRLNRQRHVAQRVRRILLGRLRQPRFAWSIKTASIATTETS
jgi:hypothetical protein